MVTSIHLKYSMCAFEAQWQSTKTIRVSIKGHLWGEHSESKLFLHDIDKLIKSMQPLETKRVRFPPNAFLDRSRNMNKNYMYAVISNIDNKVIKIFSDAEAAHRYIYDNRLNAYVFSFYNTIKEGKKV